MLCSQDLIVDRRLPKPYLYVPCMAMDSAVRIDDPLLELEKVKLFPFLRIKGLLLCGSVCLLVLPSLENSRDYFSQLL